MNTAYITALSIGLLILAPACQCKKRAAAAAKKETKKAAIVKTAQLDKPLKF